MNQEPQNNRDGTEEQPRIEYGAPQANTPHGSFWNSPSAPNPYEQNPYQQNPYAQNPYQQNPYQQNPYAQNPYGQPPYPQQPFYAPSPQYAQAQATAKSAKLFGILALILSLLCACMPLPAPILAIIGMVKAKRASRVIGGNGDITCSLVCSILAIFFTLIGALVAVIFWGAFFEAVNS